MTTKIYLLVSTPDPYYFSTDSRIEVWRWSTDLNDLTDYEKILKNRGYNVRIVQINPMEIPSVQDITEQVGRL